MLVAPSIIGLDNQKNQRRIVNIFLPIILAYVLAALKNRLIETVLLSTHNICLGWEIRKLNFRFALLTKVQGPELQCLLKAKEDLS